MNDNTDWAWLDEFDGKKPKRTQKDRDAERRLERAERANQDADMPEDVEQERTERLSGAIAKLSGLPTADALVAMQREKKPEPTPEAPLPPVYSQQVATKEDVQAVLLALKDLTALVLQMSKGKKP